MVPRVSTSLTTKDWIGTIGARSGFTRNNYKISPGLYCVGNPTEDSAVLVTANYKLTFDTVRSQLEGQNLWILVVDTRGVNVWCAAGKGTFSTEEVAYQVIRNRLAEIVKHRTIILPQLSATGVALHQLKRKCGFSAQFGPIRATDLQEYLRMGNQADERMRSVTFTAAERSVLIPVELRLTLKPTLISLFVVALLSGIGPAIFSFSAAISRTWHFFSATLVAIISGAILTPLLLPFIPTRQFWLKGLIVSSIAALIYVIGISGEGRSLDQLSLFLWIVSAGSFMAMNYTGSTPFTSLTGVEYEMRRGLPFQVCATSLALILWLASPFLT